MRATLYVKTSHAAKTWNVGEGRRGDPRRTQGSGWDCPTDREVDTETGIPG